MAAGFPWGLYGERLFVRDPRLRVSIGGLTFDNPVGLAPGLDKNARAVAALQQLGFGYLIAGSVMPRPRPGNPRPRLLRYVDRQSLINCYGQPSDGLEACAARLRRRRPGRTRVLVNVDGFSVEDYVRSFQLLEPLVDAVELNGMCPNNTDDEGDFLRRHPFTEMLKAIAPLRRKPLFVKVLPWENEAQHVERLELIERALHYGLDGITVPGTWTEQEPRLSLGRGHLTGRATFPKTLEVVKELYQVTRGQVAIKALGGISSGAEAFEAIARGASLVELLTAFVYEGWTIAARINRELLGLLAKHGIPNLGALRGSALSAAPTATLA
jgi:dihydroorotate dehydrogenase (fumarate)/dihydroorotate dehydrogenase